MGPPVASGCGRHRDVRADHRDAVRGPAARRPVEPGERSCRVPAPAFFLVGAAVASDVFPTLSPSSIEWCERIVTVALVAILFDGGLHIGWPRFRAVAGAIAWVGVAGTFVTAGALAVAGHALFGFDWQLALLDRHRAVPDRPGGGLLGARPPGDRGPQRHHPGGGVGRQRPGRHRAHGRAARRRVGGRWRGGHAVLIVVEEFALQMAVGAVVGVLGGRAHDLGAAGAAAERGPLPDPVGRVRRADLRRRRPWRGARASSRCSSPGILVGDARAPYKREIERFHTGAASLGEIVAFTVLGLTVDLRVPSLTTARWSVGLGLAADHGLRRPAAAGRAGAVARCGWRATSGCSCCGRGSRGPCRSCSAPTS